MTATIRRATNVAAGGAADVADDRPLSPALSLRATWTRPVGGYAQAVAAIALAAMPPASPTHPGPLVAVVVDPEETTAFARAAARLACRRAGRVVVHTNPRQSAAWTLGIDLLCALGKHWDRVGQGCDIHIAVLVEVWLRAEQVRDLVVLRAHQLAGKALAWLLDLAHRAPFRLWLCAPGPLVDLDSAAARLTPAVFLQRVRPHRRCRCDDLNRPAGVSVMPAETPGPAFPPRLTSYTGRLLRRLHDPEVAALATATLLLGRPDPTVLAAAEALVARDARHVTTVDGRVFRVPEHARGLLRGWAGRSLLPPAWAPDVAATYLAVRLEAAGRHTGLLLLDPARPPVPSIAWHLRADPGADVLEWLTQSRWTG